MISWMQGATNFLTLKRVDVNIAPLNFSSSCFQKRFCCCIFRGSRGTVHVIKLYGHVREDGRTARNRNVRNTLESSPHWLALWRKRRNTHTQIPSLPKVSRHSLRTFDTSEYVVFERSGYEKLSLRSCHFVFLICSVFVSNERILVRGIVAYSSFDVFLGSITSGPLRI